MFWHLYHYSSIPVSIRVRGLHLVCHFLSFWCHFLKNRENIDNSLKVTEKWQQNDRPKLKWQKMTNKMTDKIEMTKKWPKMTKNDKQNDRQNWNDMKWQKNGKQNDKQNDKQNWNHKKMTTKATIEWHIIYFDLFNLCLPKFLLNLEVLHLFRWFTHMICI